MKNNHFHLIFPFSVLLPMTLRSYPLIALPQSSHLLLLLLLPPFVSKAGGGRGPRGQAGGRHGAPGHPCVGARVRGPGDSGDPGLGVMDSFCTVLAWTSCCSIFLSRSPPSSSSSSSRLWERVKEREGDNVISLLLTNCHCCCRVQVFVCTVSRRQY